MCGKKFIPVLVFAFNDLSCDYSEITFSLYLFIKTHTVSWKQTDDNHYVVICYSPMNLPFSDNDELLTFICSGNGKISVSDVTLIDDTKQEFIMVDTNADLATGINERNNDTYSSAIHDLQGRLVSNKETRSRQVTKGIYIRNNKKVVIK